MTKMGALNTINLSILYVSLLWLDYNSIPQSHSITIESVSICRKKNGSEIEKTKQARRTDTMREGVTETETYSSNKMLRKKYG